MFYLNPWCIAMPYDTSSSTSWNKCEKNNDNNRLIRLLRPFFCNDTHHHITDCCSSAITATTNVVPCSFIVLFYYSYIHCIYYIERRSFLFSKKEEIHSKWRVAQSACRPKRKEKRSFLFITVPSKSTLKRKFWHLQPRLESIQTRK